MNDEDQIRAVVDTWMSATRAGNVDAVLDLMTDDVVFLAPGRPPMHKSEFAEQSRVPPGAPRPDIDGRSDIQEICISGDMAYIRTRLSVSMTSPEGQRLERAGYTLTVFRREQGRWRLARDANLLSPV